ncbi:unnamed protein product [Adineta steineri]|uniref:UBC core domain-containing protein n=1 Tax=Adineta steineri TaxID=433720 RepID=A0A815QB81_9BILA|nr:unnamed protein product [Adineta steineri]CAF1633053.1 unnamed protein product [Adineta steineri]
MPALKLNKELYTQITRLKLCEKTNTSVKFILEKSPFNDDDDDDDEQVTDANSKDTLIIGRIFPNSEIYREGAFRIEIKLPETYPYDAPEVRFLTPIYHPNVSICGQFSYEMLNKSVRRWHTHSLVEFVKTVVDRIDHPDIDYSLSLELGREYMENRLEFNRKALAVVRTHALPRN